jgi:Zn-dependent protease
MSAPAEPFVILPNSDAALEKDRALLKAVQDLGVGDVPGGGKMLGIVLALLFVGLGGLNWGWESVAAIGIAVALHELGHVLAMRYLGYKNVRMLFIPLFGGLATGEMQTSDAGKNACVALAGPLFGFVTTALIGVACWYAGAPPWLVGFVWISLGHNAFNLVPIYPLDGGLVMNEILFARVPTLELVFRFLACLALGFLAWLDRSWVLGLFTLLNLGAIEPAVRKSRFLQEYRRALATEGAVLDEKTVGRFRTAVQNIYPSVNADSLEKTMPQYVKGLWLELHKSYPGFGISTALLGAYGFTLVILMPVLAYLAKRWLGAPEFWSRMGI